MVEGTPRPHSWRSLWTDLAQTDPVLAECAAVNAPSAGDAGGSACPTSAPSAYQRGYDKRWLLNCNAVLAAESLCRHCAEAGRVAAAVLFDQIVPLPAGTHDRENP